MTTLPPISHAIWDMKYRLKRADGRPTDRTVEESWRRVARALARPEADRALWAERFEAALAGFRFLPAGRILAGAGTRRRVTLFNCFVMGTIPDDMGGIFQQLREAALTLQQGGGIGYDFSTLRPKGAAVRGVGADASGPLSFMDVWDSMCRTIMSAGSRRGAMMATLRCDHPDIEAFIDAKREPGRLTMFNLSVLVTDPFMAAVEAGETWPLVFGRETIRTVEARALWDRIMRATYETAEPGVIFIDRINRRNNLHYCETIASTNPCVTGETWVQTSEGPRQVADLVGTKFEAVVDGAVHASGPEGFFATGTKPVLQLTTREGHSLRLTADHPMRRITRETRDRLESEWTAAGALSRGDRILLHDHGEASAWPGAYSECEGYLIGLLIGDGTLKADKAVLSVWPGRAVANGGVERPGALGVMDAALEAARQLPHRADFNGWVTVAGRGEQRLALGALRRLALELGLSPGHKAITAAMEQASSDFAIGLLRGLFDADGSVQGNQAKGVSLRLAQSDPALLGAVQRLLLRLGIASTIYAERRPAGPRLLPDGKGGTKLYDCNADHELVIASSNIGRFARRIGFADHDKRRRLESLLSRYKRTPNRERFVARVESLVEDGSEPVFDVQVPGPNAFDANGLQVHNCGEQPLPPYGACLLGSVNLAALVERPFEAEAALDVAALEALVPTAVRLLDNAIEVSRFPLPSQRHEALAKRRIGLGVTGLADALAMCGLRYGSAEAVAATRDWMSRLRDAAYRASIALAEEKGPFPLFEREAYLAGESVQALDPEIRDAIGRHGIRNALVTSIAPTGTISLLAGNVSSGLEPIFSLEARRTILMPDGSRREELVSDYAYSLFRRLKGADAPLPKAFVDVAALTPDDHVAMQAAVQDYIDASVSKTINVPAELDFPAFKEVYRRAYESGCKGCTTYRPSELRGAVLQPAAASNSDSPEEGERLPAEAAVAERMPLEHTPIEQDGGVIYMSEPLERPPALPGRTYKLRWPESDHAIYITINDVVQDGRRRPFEIFINSKNMEHYAWTLALTRMISAVFRRGGDVSFVVEELKAVFDPRGGAWQGGRYVPSLLAAIGEVIERHMIAIGFLPAPGGTAEDGVVESQVVNLSPEEAGQRPRARQCPKCGGASLVHQEGCDLCTACGYSRCA